MIAKATKPNGKPVETPPGFEVKVKGDISDAGLQSLAELLIDLDEAKQSKPTNGKPALTPAVSKLPAIRFTERNAETMAGLLIALDDAARKPKVAKVRVTKAEKITAAKPATKLTATKAEKITAHKKPRKP